MNRVPEPKETFASYRQFVNRSKNRLRLLADYSEHLHLIEHQKRIAAQRLLASGGSFDNQTIQQLFSQVPVRQIIPRSRQVSFNLLNFLLFPENIKRSNVRCLSSPRTDQKKFIVCWLQLSPDPAFVISKNVCVKCWLPVLSCTHVIITKVFQDQRHVIFVKVFFYFLVLTNPMFAHRHEYREGIS